jgi:hypothetical protein
MKKRIYALPLLLLCLGPQDLEAVHLLPWGGTVNYHLPKLRHRARKLRPRAAQLRARGLPAAEPRCWTSGSGGP